MPDADLSATVANLRRLLEPAASRPWSEFWPSFQVYPTGEHAIVAGNVAIARDVNTQNALLIVAAVNALPSLLDAVEERDRFAEAARRLREAADARLAAGHNDTCEAILSEGYPCTCGHEKLLRAALEAPVGADSRDSHEH